MNVAMPRKRLAMAGAVAAFVAGLALMSAVPYRFFPMNERDQLIVDLWTSALELFQVRGGLHGLWVKFA